MAASQLDGSNSGYYVNSGIVSLLGEVKAFLQRAQKDSEDVPIGNLSVFSRMDGVVRHVSEVTLDAKFDSQRRRQNREEAGYASTAFP